MAPAPIDLFNENAYLSKNPDVAQAVDNGDFYSGQMHWIAFGRAEGRDSLPMVEEDSFQNLANPVSNDFFSIM
jgi:hypothetical protein